MKFQYLWWLDVVWTNNQSVFFSFFLFLVEGKCGFLLFVNAIPNFYYFQWSVSSYSIWLVFEGKKDKYRSNKNVFSWRDRDKNIKNISLE
jgi:hypothetical protein